MITEKELTKKEFIEAIKSQTQDIISEDRFREAYDLSKFLSLAIRNTKGFKDRHLDLYTEYNNIISKLSWVGLPIVPANKISDMFQYNFTDIFQIPDYDLWGKLRIVLLKILILDDRDKFKKSLRWALQKNEEKITGKTLVINNGKKYPTISNWLADYNSALGTGEISGLVRAEYQINNNNFKVLNEEEKEKIKFLFNLYEKLKLSSQTFEGLENEIPLDEDGATGVIKEGVFEPLKEDKKQRQTRQMIEDFLRERSAGGVAEKKPGVSRANNDLAELKQLAAKYPAGSIERKAVEEEISRITRNAPA